MEQEIPHAYLKRLHGLYEEWFDSYTLSPIVRIDTTKMDYVEDLVDLIELTNARRRARLTLIPSGPRSPAPA